MIILQGDPTISTSLVSLKAMWKALPETGEGVLAELGHIGVMEPPLEVSPLAPIQRILDQFQYVFQISISSRGATSTYQEPCHLDIPGTMSRNHVITLQSSTYTPLMLTELNEKLCQKKKKKLDPLPDFYLRLDV